MSYKYPPVRNCRFGQNPKSSEFEPKAFNKTQARVKRVTHYEGLRRRRELFLWWKRYKGLN